MRHHPFVLLIEDDVDLAISIEQLLRHAKCHVKRYHSNFGDALKPAFWDKVEVAVVDLALGEATTGVDILKYLKANHPHIKRIIFSAIKSYIQEAAEEADITLLKPSDPNRIVEAVLWQTGS